MRKITVAIPSFNPVKEWLQQLLDSCDGVDEIIISDDGSDQPINLEDYRFPHGVDVRLLRNDRNLGMTANFNIVTNAADDGFITVQADDDYFDKIYFQLLLRFMRKSLADVVYFPCQYFGKRDFIYGDIRNVSLNDVYEKNYIYGASFFTKEMWRFLDGFQLDFAQDWDFWLRALKSGFRFEYFPQICAHFRVTERSYFERMLVKHGRQHIHKVVHEHVDAWGLMRC